MAKKKNKKRSSGGLNTSYLTKMGAHNLIANRSMSFSSISVLTACLLLIGISLMILLNIQTLVKDVEKQNVVIAFVKDDADDTVVAQVGADLRAIPDVTNVEFVSKEVAYQEQLADFGVEQDLFDDVIENPLPDSYRISVGNLEEFNVTLEKIKAVNNVAAVRESQELVNQISTLQSSITVICIMIVIVLVFVSMFIISNTIRITMVSRKIDIQVMKSVGATNVFICWPFMIEGIIIGLISGILATGLTFAVEALEGEAMQSLLSMFGSKAISIMEYLPILIASYLLSGILISSFGSLFSIRKYLKKEGSEANDI
ncbi:MAG: permease-like cell division protein FtsX [Clostridia bacterium]|nr:permease-like cell division protein FtsX [Clostridia bacterium]